MPALFRNLVVRTSAIVFLAAMVLYAFTAAPDLALVDSAELALAAATGGVAHPPGVPLFLLLGRLFAAIPLDTPARMLNLMSAFFGAAAAGAVVLATAGTLRLLHRKDDDESGRAGAGLVAGAAFATAYNPWTWSAVTEVYTLNVFLFAAAWAAAAKAALRLKGAGRGPVPADAWPPITAAAVFAALGLANHHATALLAAPLLVGFVIGSRPSMFRSARLWITAALAVAASLSLYWYLFVAAANDVALNWGRIDSFDLLIRHVVGKQYQVQMGSSLETASEAAASFGSVLLNGVGWIPALLAAAGLWISLRARRGDRIVAMLPPILIGLNLTLSMIYVAGPEDRMAYDLPATVAWCLLAGVGAYGLLRGRRISAAMRPRLAGLVAVVVAAGNFVHHFGACNLREERVARTYVKEALGALPEGAIVLTAEWNLYAPYLYLRFQENFRPDLRVIDVLMLRRFWYMEFLERQFPDVASGEAYEAFRREVTRFDLGESYDAANIQAYYDAMIFEWIRGGDEGAGTFADASCWEHPQELSWISRVPSLPEGLWLRLTHDPSPRDIAPLPAYDRTNLEALHARMTPRALRRDPSDLPGRHHPYFRVWRVYQASVEASLLVALRSGEEEFRGRAHAYAEWFPAMDEAMNEVLRRN